MLQEDLEIGARSLHVWIARLPPLAPLIADRRSLLGEIELHRAERFRNPAAQERYLNVHIVFHLLLSGYLGVGPEAVEYRTSALGAPLPLASAGGRCFCWSLSYRGECAAYAVSTDGPVGVDIERLEPDAASELAAQCLTGPERAAVDRLAGAERTIRIFQLWTIKEAVLKRAGLGLSVPPAEVGVELQDVERPAIVLSRPHGEELSSVSVRPLDAPDGYLGAVAMDPGVSEALVRPLDATTVAQLAG